MRLESVGNLFDTSGKKVNDIFDVLGDTKVFVITIHDFINHDYIERFKQQYENNLLDDNILTRTFLSAWERWVKNHKVDLSKVEEDDNLRKHPALLYLKNKAYM